MTKKIASEEAEKINEEAQTLTDELKDLGGEFQYKTGGSKLVDNEFLYTERKDDPHFRDTEVEDKDLFTADSETAKRIEEIKLETIQTTFQKDEIEAKKKAEREAKKLIKREQEQQNKEQKAANKLIKPEQELYKRKAEDSCPRQNYITDVDNDMEFPNEGWDDMKKESERQRREIEQHLEKLENQKKEVDEHITVQKQEAAAQKQLEVQKQEAAEKAAAEKAAAEKEAAEKAAAQKEQEEKKNRLINLTNFIKKCNPKKHMMRFCTFFKKKDKGYSKGKQ